MFSAELYTHRRQGLKADIQSGLILFLGNGVSPINRPHGSVPMNQKRVYHEKNR